MDCPLPGPVTVESTDCTAPIPAAMEAAACKLPGQAPKELPEHTAASAQHIAQLLALAELQDDGANDPACPEQGLAVTAPTDNLPEAEAPKEPQEHAREGLSSAQLPQHPPAPPVLREDPTEVPGGSTSSRESSPPPKEPSQRPTARPEVPGGSTSSRESSPPPKEPSQRPTARPEVPGGSTSSRESSPPPKESALAPMPSLSTPDELPATPEDLPEVSTGSLAQAAALAVEAEDGSLSATASSASALTCKLGHPLGSCTITEGELYCNGCEGILAAGSTTFLGCRRCGYGLCAKCADMAEGLSTTTETGCGPPVEDETPQPASLDEWIQGASTEELRSCLEALAAGRHKVPAAR